MAFEALFVILQNGRSVTRSSAEISNGRYKSHFWLGSIGLGHLVPLLLMLLWGEVVLVGVVTAVCATIGLYLYEYAFVMAPQEIPNS